MKHFEIGDVLHGIGSAFQPNTTIDVCIKKIVKKRPYIYEVEIVTNPHRNAFNTSMFGSGITKVITIKTEKELFAMLNCGYTTTSNVIVPKKKKVSKDNQVVDSDEEYWNYVHSYGSLEEKEKAATYFDVSIDAFNENYENFKK